MPKEILHPSHPDLPNPTPGTSTFKSRHSILLFRVARILLLAYVVLVVGCAAFQRKLIYFPSRAPELALTAQARESGLEPWRDESSALIGWANRPTPQSVNKRFLVFHGNAGLALHRLYYVTSFKAVTDCDVYLLEYPGYGARPGSPSQDTLITAGESALRWLKKQDPSPVYLVGESIGSGVAAGVAARAPDLVAGILLVTPLPSLTDVAAYHYPFLPVRLILCDRYPAIDWLRNYRGPVAFAIAEQDEVIPARLGHRLYEAYPGPKRLWEKPGQHNTLIDSLDATWWREVVEFLESHSKAP